MINRTSTRGETHRRLRNLLLRSSPGYRAGVSQSVRVAVAFRWNEAGRSPWTRKASYSFPLFRATPECTDWRSARKMGRQPSTSGKQTSSDVASLTPQSWTDAAHAPQLGLRRTSRAHQAPAGAWPDAGVGGTRVPLSLWSTPPAGVLLVNGRAEPWIDDRGECVRHRNRGHGWRPAPGSRCSSIR